MKIEDDGHLCLHLCDLSPEYREEVEQMRVEPTLRMFTYQAKITVAYARRAGYPVHFVQAGRLIKDVKGVTYFCDGKAA